MLLSGVVWRVKSRGPRTDPWGTSKARSAVEDKQSINLILCHCPVRYNCLPSNCKPIIKSSQECGMVSSIEGSRKVRQSQCCDFASIRWCQYIIVEVAKGSFSWVKLPICTLIMIDKGKTAKEYTSCPCMQADYAKNRKLIWLLNHWAWLRRGYWHYRSLIDWLHSTDITRMFLLTTECTLWFAMYFLVRKRCYNTAFVAVVVCMVVIWLSNITKSDWDSYR